MEVGSHRLLEYADEPGRHVEYLVGRLHEDLLDLLPASLEALPAEICERLPGGSVLAACEALKARASDSDDESRAGAGLGELERRCLDTGYLSPSAHIAFWRRGDAIIIEWDNRQCRFGGEPAWTALLGNVEISLTQFVSAVRTFHHRFLVDMAARVELAAAGWPRPGVRIDVDHLREEQVRRQNLLDAAMTPRASTADWDVLVRALS